MSLESFPSDNLESGYRPKEITEKEPKPLSPNVEKNKIKLGQQLKNNKENKAEKFPTWKEVSPDEFIISAKNAIRALEYTDHKIDDFNKELLTNVAWYEKLKNSYEIVSASVGELFGDEEIHTYDDLRTIALKNGLEFVPAKLVPSILLNYPKDGENIDIAMQAIHGPDNTSRIFTFQNYSGLELGSRTISKDQFIGYSTQFFFVRKL